MTGDSSAYPLRRRPRVAVMVSGRGSNLAALLESAKDVDVVAVVSSRLGVSALQKARHAGVEHWVLSKPVDWSALSEGLRSLRVSHIFLAGFMRVLPEAFVEMWQGQLLNVHPSLLPAYPGLDSIARAVADASDVGVTLHEVVTEVDAGPLISQRCARPGRLAVAATDLMVHSLEHRMVRQVVERWAKTSTW